MFKFLKLHSSSSGDARRHVPFASIIHKHIFPVFFVTILFLTLFFRPYAAEALAQLTPEIQPVYDTTIESLYDFVRVQLDDTHKQVFDLLLGSYMVGYAGMSDYKLSYSYNSDTPVKEWLINSGVDLYNSILSLGGLSVSSGSTYLGVPKIGAKELSPLIQTAMGCALKAKTYNNVDAAYNDITTSDAYPIPLTVDIMYSINAAMGYYDGLYDWQFKKNLILPSSFTFDWGSQSTLSGNNNQIFYNYLDQMSNPIKFKYDHGYKSSSYLTRYHNIFVNTSNNTVYCCDDNGNAAPSNWISVDVLYYAPGTNSVVYSTNSGTSGYAIQFKNLNYLTYGSLQSLFNALNSNPNTIVYSLYGVLDLSTFVKGLYYGPDWSNKEWWSNDTDLNLDVPNQPTFLQGVENGLLDLKGLLEDILGSLELRPPVINNYYYPDGSNVPVTDIEAAMQNNTLPESGVDIDQNLFVPLFSSDGKKSYISYLWYMTKPLVLYTKDLFSCLVFDPVADFAGSGPGYFVYGVVGLGLISGLLVKCLL